MPESVAGDVVLQAGQARATIRPLAGARVCDLVLQHPDGHTVPILYPYRAPDVDAVHWAKGGIYPLVPYSNRIGHGQLNHPGGLVRLPAHPNTHPHTLHGHAHVVPWELVAQGAATAHLRLDSPPCDAWPWHFQADTALSHLVLHRPADPLYLCIEPVSHVADGFNLAARAVRGTGSVFLPQGGQLRGELTLSLSDTIF